MKKVLSLLLVMLILASTLALVSCGGGRVPVYQGMTIGSAMSSWGAVDHDSDYELFADTNNGKGNDGDNGNHYGNGNQKPGDVDGDHDGRDDGLDKNNPYPDNDQNENIENEINSSLNVVGSVYDVYYAQPNEDIYIYIHIDNPDNYEIMSFTLNGKKYSNYMFEAGSDMETIILKYNVGSNSGIVEYTIDAIKYIDGTAIKDVVINGNKTVMAGIRTTNQVAASATNMNISANSVSFDVNIKDNDNLAEFSGGCFKAVLYDGDNIIDEIDLVKGTNSIKFENLKTNTLYQYAIVGYYDNLSGSGFGMNVLYKDAFYTESVVLFDNVVLGQDSVDFTFLWNEDATSKNITSLKLYKDGKLEKELSTSANKITGLLSNNTYVLVAEYSNAGNTESIYIEFTTFEKGVPGITLNKTGATESKVEFEIIEVDKENVGNITKIELIHNGTSTLASSTSVREFTNLLSNNAYTVRVTYEYNLNDGKGTQTIVKEVEIRTRACIDVIDCQIANTSAVSEGETIYMQVKLDNPSGMKIESIVINGKTYNVTGASTSNKIFVEIVYNGQFAGGNTYLKIDQINASLSGESYTITPKSELGDNVFINGKLELVSLQYVNKNFEPIDYVFASDELYILFTFDNPTGYIIDDQDLTRLDDNRWYRPLETRYNNYQVSAITYHNEYISKTITFEEKHAYVFVVPNDEIVYVSTVEDLKNVDQGFHYVLTNDIDLSGIEWSGVPFYGFLDGNGYSIKNMSFVGTISNTDASLGLFSTASGVIQNLNIQDATIIANVTGDEYVQAGFFVAQNSEALIMKNCIADKNSVLSLTVNEAAKVYVGGFVGRAGNKISFANCVNSGAIISNGSSNGQLYSGGFIGRAGSKISFANCSNEGNVSSNSDYDDGIAYSGGFVGFASSATFVNCANIGNVNVNSNGNSNVGGFVGRTSSSYLVSSFNNCVNGGVINGRPNAGGFIGKNAYNEAPPELINSYSFYQGYYGVNGESCTVAQLNSKDFYTKTLGWSEDIWDFSNLDVENGKGPKLK